MTANSLPGGSGLTSLTAGFSDLGNVETWRPRRIAIAGVRFQSGGDGKGGKTPESLAGGGDAAAVAAAAKATADAAALEAANKGKTPEQIAADKKTADDAAAAQKVIDDKKAADDLAAKKGKGKEGDEGQPKAPAKYELKVPDDAKEFVADEDLKDLETVARENDWTQEEAQAYLDGQLDRSAKRLEKQREGWKTETSADPDYGGDKLEETTKLSRAAVTAIRPVGHPRREAFLRFLNRGGAGNNIEVVSFLADLGKLIGEDAPNLGAGHKPAEGKKPDADVMFPTSAAKS